MGIGDLRTAVRLTEKSRWQVRTDFLHVHLAAAQYWSGDWDRALTSADQAMAIASLREQPWTCPWAHSVAAWVAAGRGEWTRARDHLLEGDRCVRDGVSDFSRMFLSIAEAVLAQAQCDYDAVLRALAQIPLTGMSTLYQTWWLPLQAEALIGTGRYVEAAAGLARLRRFTAECDSLEPATAWLSGWLAERRGDLRSARLHYGRGVRILVTPNQPPLHRGLLAQVHGRLLLNEGRETEAARWFRHAATTFERLRATPFLDRCNADLQLGSAMTVVARAATTALSEREHEMAIWVGRGYTNREIAAELFISVKTVEYHLGNIYAKLGINGRYQLRKLMQSTSAV